MLSKQVGLVCHPSVDHDDGTLVNALIYHCGAENLCNVQGEDDRLGIVHRLDRDTSGHAGGEDDETGYALMSDIRDRAVDRRYLALVHGVIAHDTGMIDAPIARAEKERTRMAVRDTPSTRGPSRHFRCSSASSEHGARDDGYTLIDCKLFMAAPIRYACIWSTRSTLMGDPAYTSGAPERALPADLGLDRQFLHSFQLSFQHPVTGEGLRFADNLPVDLQEALDDLASRSTGRTTAGEEVRALLEDAPRPRL